MIRRVFAAKRVPEEYLARVVQVLARLIECYGRPAQLHTDNGPEFIIALLSEWCEAQGIIL